MNRWQSSRIDVVRFGDCEVSRAERLLRRSGRIVPLQARPFDLLLYLIENRDRVISRDELLKHVWKGISVNEQAQRFAVHSIRRAIGDSGDAQRIIRTVRGNGLQFIAAAELGTRLTAANAMPLDSLVGQPFLGRESFLRSVDRALDRVAGSHGYTLLATGEAGIGKTTALSRMARSAGERGFLIGSARCPGTDDAPALWPWTQVLRRLIEREGRSWLADTMARGADAIAWVLPELQDLVPPSRRSPKSDSRASRYQLFDGIRFLVGELSLRTPVGVLIDDLHGADSGTLLLFEYLASELSESRFLLFGTLRPHGQSYEKCAAMLSSVLRRPNVELASLERLTEREVTALTEARSGFPPSNEVARSLVAKTGGNPFFVSQVLTVLENEGRLDSLRAEEPLAFSIPSGVRDAVKRQTDVLPEHVYFVLSLASVVEKEFTSALLDRALGADSVDVLRALESAVGAGICVKDVLGNQFRFAHDLVREAIYCSLTSAERAENHGRIALAMADAIGPDSGPHSGEIARHFAAVYPAPIASKALRFLINAAHWDVERAAFGSAAVHLERALNLLEGLCPGDMELRCEILLELGFAYGLEANREKSRAALIEAARLAESCERPDLAARAAMCFAPDLLAIETGIYDRGLVDLLERALAALPDESDQRPRVLARLAVALHWSDEPRDRIKRLVDEALARARDLGGSEMASYVRTAGQLALYSVEFARESVEQSKSVTFEDDSTTLLRTILRITALWQVGDMREVDIEVQSFDELLKRARRPSASWYVAMLRSTRALMRGQYDIGMKLSEEFLREGLGVDDRNALHSFALQRAMTAIDVGGLEAIEPAVAGMASNFPRVEGWLAGLSYLYSELGKRDEARDVMSEAVGRGALTSFPRNSWFGTLGSLTLACRVIESPDLVESLYPLWLRFSGQLAVVGFSSFCWGSTDRFLGVLAGLMRQWDTSEAHFGRAITANRVAGAYAALAHTYADHASMRDQKQLGAGRESRDLALQQARALGMKGLESRILREAPEV
jgi:DNA-binding winged helix-turn-helix (wHTH) protein